VSASMPPGRDVDRPEAKTALAARVTALSIGSSWTNFGDRSSLDGTA
jgi:hypothetical protein